MPKDLSTQILIQIRDEIRSTNARLDQTNARLTELEKRQVESEIRLATELVGVASAVRELKDLFKEDRKLRATVDAHERRIASLEKRVGRGR
jgi:hypothetical protein